MVNLRMLVRNKLGKINHCRLEITLNYSGNSIRLDNPTINPTASYPINITQGYSLGQYILTKPNVSSLCISLTPSRLDVLFFEMDEPFIRTEAPNGLKEVIRVIIQ